MEPSQIYILIAIIVLLIIAILVVVVKKNKKVKPLTPLAGLAFVFILMGIFSISILEDNRLITYSLFGIGVVLAVIDMVMKRKGKQ